MNVKTVYCFVFLIWFCVISERYGAANPAETYSDLVPVPKTKRSAEQDICNLPKVVGKCSAIHNNFYYNSAAKKCEKFVYGGCGGNENNFKTLAECQKACAKM